jgi:hypothetical protein
MEKNRVLFLDIDGPLIPGRAYMLPNQTKPIVKTFDPVAVSLINEACKNRRQIVVHSSWLRYPENYEYDLVGYMVKQGINRDLFHADPLCDGLIHWRYNRIREWLARHPEVTDYVVVDDEPDPDGHVKGHLVLVDFEDGLMMKQFRQLKDGDWR